MKKLLTILITLLLSMQLSAQSKNLEFNRVIDTLIVAEVNTCTDLYNNPVYGPDLVVPAGKVWKIESLGTEGVKNTGLQSQYTYLRNSDCYGTNYIQSVCKGLLIVNYPNYEFNLIDNLEMNVSLPIWLNAGSSINAKIFGNEVNHRWTVNSYLPYTYNCFVSIIEFNVTQ